MSTAQGLGAALGAGVQTGVQSGLQNLISNFNQKKEASSLATVLGLEGEQKEAFGNLPPDIQKTISPVIIKQKQEIQKAEQLQLKEQEKTEILKGTISNIRELAEGGLQSRTPFTKDGRFRKSKINALGEKVFAELRGDLIKGNTPQKVFDFIQKAIVPNANDTNATIEGKLQALEQIRGLEDKSGLTTGNVKSLLESNIQQAEQTLPPETRGKRIITLVSPDGKEEVKLVLNSPQAKAAIKAGAKVKRGR